MTRLAETLGITWPVEAAEVALAAHLPGSLDRDPLDRSGTLAGGAHERAFGPAGESFWPWQEVTAAALWDVALRGVPWPPQTVGERRQCWPPQDCAWRARCRCGCPAWQWTAFRPLGAHLKAAPERTAAVRGRPTAECAAQVTSTHANALYGAAALDMPRRGVARVPRWHWQARQGVGQRRSAGRAAGCFSAKGSWVSVTTGRSSLRPARENDLRGGLGRLQLAALGRSRAAG